MQKVLEQKAAQLLEVEQVRSLHNKLMDINQEKVITPVFMIKEILIRFAEGPEFRQLENEYQELLEDLPRLGEAKEKLNLNKPADLEKFKDKVKAYNEQAARLNSIIERAFNTALQLHSEGRLTVTWPAGLEPEELSKYIMTANSQLYYNFRHRLGTGRFISGEGWPEADISGSKVKGKALLKPDNISPVAQEDTLRELRKHMLDRVKDLVKNGDLATDILDIVIAKHLKETNNPYEPIKMTADDFLEARGIKKVLSGSGRRGGYKDEWRQEIAKYIYILSDAFLEVAEMEVYEHDEKGKRKKTIKKNLHSRAVVLSSLETQGRILEGPDISAWYVRPGDCFMVTLSDPFYQTALLSKKALEYNYGKHKYEKRLTKYFYHLWRMDNPKEKLRVSTLLNEIELELDQARPGRTRNRLEDALNRLQEDEVITAWKYETWNESLTARRKWWRQWLESKVIITAPEAVLNHYKPIKEKREQLKGKKR